MNEETRLALPHAGLIWMLGPGGCDHLLFALAHHRAGGGAAHCWLVMQDAPRVRAAFRRLAQALAEAERPTRLHPVILPSLEARAAREAVRGIYAREAARVGLAPEQGKGIGDALVQTLLKRADAEDMPVYLETHDQRNVGYYERHGFELVLETSIPKHDLPIWCMRWTKASGMGGARSL